MTKIKNSENSKCWRRCGETGHSYIVSGSMQWHCPNWKVSYKTEHAITVHINICIPGHSCQRNEDSRPHTKLYANVHNSFVCNRPKLESVQMSLNRKMVETSVLLPQHGTLLSDEKEHVINMTTQPKIQAFGRVKTSQSPQRVTYCIICNVSQ